MHRSVWFWLARAGLLSSLIALAIVGVTPVSASDTGQTHTITIEGMKFSPSAVRIRLPRVLKTAPLVESGVLDERYYTCCLKRNS